MNGKDVSVYVCRGYGEHLFDATFADSHSAMVSVMYKKLDPDSLRVDVKMGVAGEIEIIVRHGPEIIHNYRRGGEW